ncbi:MAG: hypothetical protein C0402_04735 [Thermodesulfovibrio sp.]|nr:hypothetical protein [Thermodesulfovibrio sp.]
MEGFIDLVMEPIKEVFIKFRLFLPNFLAMLTIVVLGLFLAWITKKILSKVLNVLRFDSWCDKTSITAMMRKGDIWTKPSDVLVSAIFWLFTIVSVMVGFSALNIHAINNLVTQFFLYLPSALSAVLILLIGYMVSGFLSRAALIAAVNGGLSYAKFLANAVRLLLAVLFFAMALEQLNVAPNIVVSAFTIIFGGIVIALAISFGIAGIETAKKIIEGKEAEPGNDKKGDVEHI